MLLALVLAACVAPAAHEWVEISQQHYRKPSLTLKPDSTFYPTTGDTSDDLRHKFYPANEGTTDDDHTFITDKRPTYEQQIEQNIPNRVYINHSIAEHHWNDNRVSNIKRVDGSTKIRPNVTPEFSLEIFGEITESEPEVTSGYSDTLKDKEVFSATIERVPIKGNVKRVQLTNTPVKSPSFTNAVSPIRRNDIRPHGSAVDFSDEIEIEDNIFENSEDNAATPINKVKNVFSSTQETTMLKYDRVETSTSEPVMIFEKYPYQQFDNTRKHNNDVRNSENSNVKNVATEKRNRVNNQQLNKNVLKTTFANRINEEKTREEIPNITKSDEIIEPVDVDLEEVNYADPKNNVLNTDKKNIPSPKTQEAKPNVDSSSNGEKNRNKEIKVDTMENVMRFVKVVADTISKNTNRGVNGKVKYLNELKDTLLSSIKERIDATWPDDARGARRSREARGHVEFPSSESSLMTISFLTFAVFLIKLVLQVIQTYKNKTMMVAPLVVATAGRALHKLKNFH